jgi:AmmeMemoRadiSam system protein A
MSPPSEPPAANFHLVSEPADPGSGEFSAEERKALLLLAREAIRAVLESRELSLVPPSQHFAERRGAFTTLYAGGELRGCVGYALPVTPLYRTVAETARAAAFDDNRFCPMRKDELPGLEISLSILSPLRPIRPEEVEVGKHGLLVTLGEQRGLLLPQVPIEHGWDRVTFLQQTCRKAGLPLDCWQSGAKLEAFTAEVFGDHELP